MIANISFETNIQTLDVYMVQVHQHRVARKYNCIILYPQVKRRHQSKANWPHYLLLLTTCPSPKKNIRPHYVYVCKKKHHTTQLYKWSWKHSYILFGYKPKRVWCLSSCVVSTHLKNMLGILDHFPNNRGANQKKLSCHQPETTIYKVSEITNPLILTIHPSYLPTKFIQVGLVVWWLLKSCCPFCWDSVAPSVPKNDGLSRRSSHWSRCCLATWISMMGKMFPASNRGPWLHDFDMGVSKNRGIYPKVDGEDSGKPY